MNSTKPQGFTPQGFTLVEVLIVVVLMAVLAAAIIPQFADTTADVKVDTALFNLHTLRSQLELYRVQHDSLNPSADLSELTRSTNVAGRVGSTAAHRFGPYVRSIPENTINGLSAAKPPASNPPLAEVRGAGWLYDAGTGEIWLNAADYLSE